MIRRTEHALDCRRHIRVVCVGRGRRESGRGRGGGDRRLGIRLGAPAAGSKQQGGRCDNVEAPRVLPYVEPRSFLISFAASLTRSLTNFCSVLGFFVSLAAAQSSLFIGTL